MAKKFGKFLLFISMVGAAFAGAYYFMKSKDTDESEDEYDDLDDDSDEVSDVPADGERSYVSLNPEEKSSGSETVEEFFDDEDDEDGSLDAM